MSSGKFQREAGKRRAPLRDDPGWTDVLVGLLAKVPSPEVFKHLRPIALLNASAKVWSRLMFNRLLLLDEDNDPRCLSNGATVWQSLS